MGHRNKLVEAYISPEKYDVLLYLAPDVKWVDDGMRLNGSPERRKALDQRLMDMYREFGFRDKLVVISGDYNERLTKAIALVDDMLKLNTK